MVLMGIWDSTRYAELQARYNNNVMLIQKLGTFFEQHQLRLSQSKRDPNDAEYLDYDFNELESEFRELASTLHFLSDKLPSACGNKRKAEDGDSGLSVTAARKNAGKIILSLSDGSTKTFDSKRAVNNSNLRTAYANFNKAQHKPGGKGAGKGKGGTKRPKPGGGGSGGSSSGGRGPKGKCWNCADAGLDVNWTPEHQKIC